MIKVKIISFPPGKAEYFSSVAHASLISHVTSTLDASQPRNHQTNAQEQKQTVFSAAMEDG